MNFKKISNLNKKIILILSDLFIIVFSVAISFSLRLEQIYPFWMIDYRVYFIFFVIIIPTLYFFNIYQILLRFFDNYSILIIIKTIFVCQIILIIINFSVFKIVYFPRSISFIAPIFIGILIVIHRIILNYIINTNEKKIKHFNNILIYGIDKNTVSLLKNLRQFPNYGIVKCFVDSTGEYKAREINGIKIYKNENLEKVIENNSITEIILGPKTFRKKIRNYLLNKLENKNVRIVNMDEIESYLPSLIHKSFESKLSFYDIIDRPKIKADKRILNKTINNKNVLVSGGGGSIGGELCVQILNLKAKNIYILDSAEINLFNIINKLKSLKNNYSKIHPILGDCSDKSFLIKKFENIKLDYVYHAAAYKHVGFGELNPYSIVKNNIFGTKSVLEFSIVKKVRNFIFVSSDKAVNPKSILGFTKNFGEVMVLHYYKNIKNKKNVKFTVVRFGNVIGSSGSVIPIFLSQIKNKSPLTVTNNKAERYFMSISEAVELIVHSSYLSKGYNIFSLDMGKQIKIFEIAKRIIRLSGNTIKNSKNPKGDISIKITGLKKGEKISEEISLGKNLKKTSHPKIMLCQDFINDKNINQRIAKIKYVLDLKKLNKQVLKKIILS